MSRTKLVQGPSANSAVGVPRHIDPRAPVPASTSAPTRKSSSLPSSLRGLLDMATARKEIGQAKKLEDNELQHLSKNSRLSGRLGRAVDKELRARNLPAALIPAGHADSPGVAPDEPWIERRGDITFLHGPTDDTIPEQSELAFGADDPVGHAEGDAAPGVYNIVLSGHGDADIRPEGYMQEIPDNSLGMNFYGPLGGMLLGGSDTTSELLAQGNWSGLRRDYREHYAPGRFIPQHTLNPLTAEEALRLGNITNAQGRYVRPGKNVTVVRVAKTIPLSDILDEVQQRFPDRKLLFHWGLCRADATQGKLVDKNGKEITSNTGSITAKTGGIFEFSGPRSATSRFIAGRLSVNPERTPRPAIAPALTRAERAAQSEKAVRVEDARKAASAKAALDLLESGEIWAQECELRVSNLYPSESAVRQRKDQLSQIPLVLLLGGRISEQEYESRLSLIYADKAEQHEKNNKLKNATWRLFRSGKISSEEYQARVRKSIVESMNAQPA